MKRRIRNMYDLCHRYNKITSIFCAFSVHKDAVRPLTGGQVAGIVIGVIGTIIIIVVLIYVARATIINSSRYRFSKSGGKSSIGFDNALFTTSQDTVSVGSS